MVYAFICLFVINVIADRHRRAGAGAMSALGSFDATMRFRRMLSGLPRMLDGIGEQGLFYGESLRYIPNALTRYRRETIRLIAEMAMGSGAWRSSAERSASPRS